MQSEETEKLIIKKDFFIKSRQEDIRKFYEFNPKILGRGAYGIVYKARLIDPPHSNRVVKLIAKKLVKNPQCLQNEIDILRRLDHPMIVRLYETFEDDKNLYLVQDYCEGGELFERLEQHGNFSEEDARQMFVQMIKAIKYLHSEKICHRDLKPENFLMNNKTTLELKLIDFGLSYPWKHNMREELKEEKRNKLIGTSYYIAPEVLKLDYDQKCDIWSAGVILYILVTAAPPFDGENDRQIMENVKKLEWSFDIPEAKNLSQEIRDLLRKILVPAERRITIQQILAHPWINKKLNNTPLKLDFSKLKNFSNFSKFKALAISYIATQLPQKDIHLLGQLFSQIDTNSDGYLTVEELKVALEKQHENTTYAELKNLIEHIDTDKNGKINYNQFLSCCLETSFTQNQQYLQYVFRSFDKDKSGRISKREIKEIFEDSGIQSLTGKAIDEIIESCDANHDGEIDFREFMAGMGLKK